jgi:hypothetical protein
MNETQKTVTYIGIALVLGIVTVLARPRQEPVSLPGIVGKQLFEKFTDPTKAAGLEVVRYVEDVGEVHTFEVAKSPTGLWSIPSHGNYPADAQDQMKEAASSLSDLTVFGVASQKPEDHQMYGVIEPNKEKLKVGDKGVGLLVAFKDEKGVNLARVIVGKTVKEVSGAADKRFVRIPGQDPVYVVKINTDKLSTKFEDWIEKDLLKVNTFDVERLRLKDYSVVPTQGGYGIQPRSEVTASFNSADAKWKLDDMITYKGSEAIRSDLLEGEELNKEKLDALKSALADVKIVDVYRKPKGLGATLKASGDFAKDMEARRSLESRGFILNDNELLAANGELHALTKDGVEYVLRFGNVAGEEEGSSEGKLNRYLFVTARVDESKFPRPELAPVPGEPAAAPPAKPSSDPDLTPANPADKPAATEKPAATDNPPATDQPAAAEPAAGEPAKPADSPAATVNPPTDPSDCTVNQDEKKSDAAAAAGEDQPAKPAEPQKPTDPPAAADPVPQAPAKESTTSEAKPASDAKEKAPPAADTEKKADTKKSDEDLAKKKLDADRDRVMKENQRKLDDWNEKKKKAEETVHELNGRFADWYYVISEDVYKKLHLSRSDIIKEGAKAADEGTGLNAFKKLKTEGLKKSDPKKPAAPPPFPMP